MSGAKLERESTSSIDLLQSTASVSFVDALEQPLSTLQHLLCTHLAGPGNVFEWQSCECDADEDDDERYEGLEGDLCDAVRGSMSAFRCRIPVSWLRG